MGKDQLSNSKRFPIPVMSTIAILVFCLFKKKKDGSGAFYRGEIETKFKKKKKKKKKKGKRKNACQPWNLRKEKKKKKKKRGEVKN